jgi:hypothetical protein
MFRSWLVIVAAVVTVAIAAAPSRIGASSVSTAPSVSHGDTGMREHKNRLDANSTVHGNATGCPLVHQYQVAFEDIHQKTAGDYDDDR